MAPTRPSSMRATPVTLPSLLQLMPNQAHGSLPGRQLVSTWSPLTNVALKASSKAASAALPGLAGLAGAGPGAAAAAAAGARAGASTCSARRRAAQAGCIQASRARTASAARQRGRTGTLIWGSSLAAPEFGQHTASCAAALMSEHRLEDTGRGQSEQSSFPRFLPSQAASRLFVRIANCIGHSSRADSDTDENLLSSCPHRAARGHHLQDTLIARSDTPCLLCAAAGRVAGRCRTLRAPVALPPRCPPSGLRPLHSRW